MSSRFVSGGAIDAETGEAVEAAPVSTHQEVSGQGRKKDEWLAVQRELEAERQQREEQRIAAAQQPEKSLFEVLQANKEAKQAAFEEANKFKNQFRALDDDEIDFLDGVKAAQRAEEERVRRETEQGLEAFRAAQKQTEQGAARAEGDASEDEDLLEDSWAAAGSRKRRREKEKERLRGVKRRASSLKEADEKKDDKKHPKAVVSTAAPAEKKEEAKEQPIAAPVVVPARTAKAGLVDYGSSDDDDD